MEAIALGVSSGLACVVSCGPVLLPWLASERRPLRPTSLLLAGFLAGRLVGYLAFAVVAWAFGLVLAGSGRAGSVAFAVAHLALAALLLVFVVSARARGASACASSAPVRLARRLRWLAPAALGLLTGVSPCPPFVAAGLRAAERESLAGSLAFFVLFFVGTSIWFAPFTAVAGLRRMEAVATVARLATVIIAAYYGYIGAVALGGAVLHG